MAFSTYMPYGAYELKARYQFNLMLATLITALAVTLLLVSAWAFSIFAVEEVPESAPRPPHGGIIDLPPPPIVIPETPDIGTATTETVVPEYFIPVPVIDEEIIDENVILATKVEKVDLVNRRGGDIIGAGKGFVIDEGAVIDAVPPVDSFIILEIYPEMIYRHVPQYPRLIEIAGIEGVVWVRVLVSEEGKVLDAIVHKPSGTTALDDAALEAAYKNVFKPGIQNGRPVKCWVSYKVVFELNR